MKAIPTCTLETHTGLFPTRSLPYPTFPSSPPSQGPVCVTIAATYDTSNVRTTPSYTDSFEPLAPTTTFSKTVCLHKLTRQANAKLDFDMCTNNQCEEEGGGARGGVGGTCKVKDREMVGCAW